MAPEEVLVVSRSVLEDAGVFQGLTLDVARYLPRLLGSGAPRFLLRSTAETDPSYKQLIPYVILTHGGRCLSYVRGKRGGEGRLHGNRSIGIGGHINPVDDLPLLSSDFTATYRAAVEREVAEEIKIDGPHTDRIVALLNDDSTPVGQVHWGIVHLWNLETPNVTKREQAITQLAFMTPAELAAVRDTLETWSQFCLDRLPELFAAADRRA